MKDLQVRFGIVLLIIISVVSFMLGRSLRPLMDSRSRGDVAVGTTGGDAAPPSGEEGRKPNI